MSEEASFEEFDGDETEFSLNVSASSDESTNTEANASLSYSESLVEDESGLEKDSENLSKSLSDTETTASESYSEDIDADSSTSSWAKETTEVFKVEGAEQDASENESQPFSNKEQTSTEFQQSVTKVVDTRFERKTGEDFPSDEKLFNNSEQSATRKAKSSTAPLEFADESEPGIETSVEDVLDETDEQDATGTKQGASSHAEQGVSASNKSPPSPTMNVTYVMTKLNISDSPESEKKSTPRQSRFRARTINTSIFDSPYNTRLKARMIKEREMRSRSEGPTNE